MIAFLHPGFLYAALGVAAGIVALHFIVTEQPRTGVLSTVRFFPDVPARATTLTLRLSDLLLLSLRVLTVLLVGAAFAQPRINPQHRAVATVVAVARNIPEADSALPYIRNAAAVVYFDSLLSSALIQSLREASRVRERADSIELVVVSPLTTRQTDAATLAIRSQFPGRIRLVRVSADTTRAQPTAAEIQWADSSVSPLWIRRAAPDTVGAVATSTATLVYPFVRRWQLADNSANVIARWVDGEPAIVERVSAGTCVRSVSFSLPAIGDAILRPDFVRFRDALNQPCGGLAPAPVSADFFQALQGPANLAPASAIEPRVTRMTPLVPWLLAAALVVALVELIVRRRQRQATAQHDASGALARAA